MIVALPFFSRSRIPDGTLISTSAITHGRTGTGNEYVCGNSGQVSQCVEIVDRSVSVWK